MALAWRCASCGECDSRQRTGSARYCNSCKTARSLYNTTKGNLKSGFNRKTKGSPELSISIDEFCKWRKRQVLQCHYCGIREADIPSVGMKSQIQLPVKVLGVDRRDSSQGYIETNLVPCCFVCNQIKGDRFSYNEMKAIGKAISSAWSERLRRPNKVCS